MQHGPCSIGYPRLLLCRRPCFALNHFSPTHGPPTGPVVEHGCANFTRDLTGLCHVVVRNDFGWRTRLFDAALSLTFFLLAGRYLDYRTRRVARSAAQDIAALELPRVMRMESAAQVETAVQDLEIGDLIFLPTGTRLPVTEKS